MSKVIIGIHGLGNKPSKEILKEWWETSIKEGLIAIGKPQLDFDFKMIYWADVFHEKPLDEHISDKNDPLYLTEKYVPASMNDIPEEHPFRQKVLDIVEKQLDSIFLNEDLTINFSGIADSIIHRYFKELDYYYSIDNPDSGNPDINARNVIRMRVLKELDHHINDDIMLIGHSMGSIIGYDVINYITNEIDIDTFVTIGSPLGFPVIMGKIAADRNIFLPKLNKLKTPEAVRKNWYNLSDLEDMIALIYRLSENFDANNRGIQVTDLIVHNNYEINGEKNPHKSFGYLRTPQMARIIYNFMVTEKMNVFRRIKKRWKKLTRFYRKRLTKNYDLKIMN